MAEAERNSIKFEIIESLGVLKQYPTGWNKELNLVAWNDKPAKYDIRDWSPTHERMSRGITLHIDEMEKLIQLMQEKYSVAEAEEEEAGTEELAAAEDVRSAEEMAQVDEEQVPF